jgi:hypothetical protein
LRLDLPAFRKALFDFDHCSDAIYLIALALITYIPAITLAPLLLWR